MQTRSRSFGRPKCQRHLRRFIRNFTGRERVFREENERRKSVNMLSALKFWGAPIKLTTVLVSLCLPSGVPAQQSVPDTAKGGASEPSPQIAAAQPGKK